MGVATELNIVSNVGYLRRLIKIAGRIRKRRGSGRLHTLVIATPRSGSTLLSGLMSLFDNSVSITSSGKSTKAHSKYPTFWKMYPEAFANNSLHLATGTTPFDRWLSDPQYVADRFSQLEDMIMDDMESVGVLKLMMQDIVDHHSAKFIISCLSEARQIQFSVRDDEIDQIMSYVVSIETNQWNIKQHENIALRDVPPLDDDKIAFRARMIAWQISLLYAVIHLCKQHQIPTTVVSLEHLERSTLEEQRADLSDQPEAFTAAAIVSQYSMIAKGTLPIKLRTKQEKEAFFSESQLMTCQQELDAVRLAVKEALEAEENT